MTKAGMPPTRELRITFTEVAAEEAGWPYVHLADSSRAFGPTTSPPSWNCTRRQTGVRMVLTFDAMHSDEWTERATTGWESELEVAARLDLVRGARS